MGAPSSDDWGKIHAKAWKDADFRDLLERDPKEALAVYGGEVGKTFSKVVTIADKPADAADHELHEHEAATAPPACC